MASLTSKGLRRLRQALVSTKEAGKTEIIVKICEDHLSMRSLIFLDRSLIRLI